MLQYNHRKLCLHQQPKRRDTKESLKTPRQYPPLHQHPHPNIIRYIQRVILPQMIPNPWIRSGKRIRGKWIKIHRCTDHQKNRRKIPWLTLHKSKQQQQMGNSYIIICWRLKKFCHNDTQNTFKLTRTIQIPTACRSIMGTPSQHLRRETTPIKMRLYTLQWLFQPDGTSKVENTSEFQIPIISLETGDSINVPYLHPNQPVSHLGHTS